MFHYQIIKITENRDTTKFAFEISRMRDSRVRMGILKANYKDYLAGDKEKYNPVFEIFACNNYSFCSVFRRNNINLEDVKVKRDEINNWYMKRQSYDWDGD
jgi:hypothetical protein